MNTVYLVWSRGDGEMPELFGVYSTEQKALEALPLAWRDKFSTELPEATDPDCTPSFRSSHYNSVYYYAEELQ